MNQLLAFTLTYKYVGIFIATYATSAVVPLPGAAILLAVGSLSREAYFSLFLVYPIALSATVLGDYTTYLFVRAFKKQWEKDTHKKNKIFTLVKKFIHTHPYNTIVITRFIGFSTTSANVIAGLTKLPARTFLLADIVGNALCVGFYLMVGYFVAQVWRQENLLSLTTYIVVGFSIVYLMGLGAFYMMNARD